MPLIVEDGSVVAGADSWVTVQQYIDYGFSIGVQIADDEHADYELRKACQYINDQEQKLSGTRISRAQTTAYPRSNLVIEGWEWSGTEIPRQVILAQMQVALDIREGVDPYNPPPNPSSGLKSVKVDGAVAIEYAIEGGQQKLSKTSKSQALLNSLFKRGSMYMIPIIK